MRRLNPAGALLQGMQRAVELQIAVTTKPIPFEDLLDVESDQGQQQAALPLLPREEPLPRQRCCAGPPATTGAAAMTRTRSIVLQRQDVPPGLRNPCVQWPELPLEPLQALLAPLDQLKDHHLHHCRCHEACAAVCHAPRPARRQTCAGSLERAIHRA